jgi:hypothetical protein
MGITIPAVVDRFSHYQRLLFDDFQIIGICGRVMHGKAASGSTNHPVLPFNPKNCEKSSYNRYILCGNYVFEIFSKNAAVRGEVASQARR